MTKKQTQATWTGVAIGLGISAVLAWPALGAIMAYYKAPAAQKPAIRGVFDKVAGT